MYVIYIDRSSGDFFANLRHLASVNTIKVWKINLFM